MAGPTSKNLALATADYMNFIITAGPTREAIDPVRYLTNKSSGKMGYAIAQAAIKAGHQVTLISGPTNLDIPDGVDFLPVETADEMYEAVERWIPKAEIAIFAAAVADYRPISISEQKIKKHGETMTLELTKNRDILGSCRSLFHYSGTLIGFAAETQTVIENARLKLERKQCDLIVANDVSRTDIGFDNNENEIFFVEATSTESIPKADKHHLAHLIIDKAVSLRTKAN